VYAQSLHNTLDQYDAEEAEMPTTQTFTVVGMTCGHCRAAVAAEVAAVAGVREVDVDLATGALTVTGTDVAPTAVAAAVAEAGYEVAP
jgi:copper chaperone CopZ